jgi:hypothetical protein
VIPVYVASGQPIQVYGYLYGSGTAPTGGSYTAYIVIEQM